jgi:purine-binding chemotaxis protein CheW
MNTPRIAIVGRAAELRRQFDRAFAEARPPQPAPSEDLLAIRLGGETYALRLGEIAGLVAGLAISPVPGLDAPLLGIAAIRGAVTPVYDLATMLGHPPTRRPRWLVLAAGTRTGFAVAEFDGCRRVPSSGVVPHQDHAGPRRHISEFVRTADFACPVVSLTSAVAAVQGLYGRRTRQEQKTC